MKRLLIAALVPFALMGASIGHAHAQAKLTKNFFKYDNIKYRRSGASSATLGSAGIVRKTLLKAYNFERKESLPKSLRKKVGIKRVTRVKGSQMKELKHKGMFKYLGLSVKDTISQLKKSELDLVKIELDHGKYKDAGSDFVKKIRQIKPKGGIRTIVTIWLIVEAKMESVRSECPGEPQPLRRDDPRRRYGSHGKSVDHPAEDNHRVRNGEGEVVEGR